MYIIYLKCSVQQLEKKFALQLAILINKNGLKICSDSEYYQAIK